MRNISYKTQYVSFEDDLANDFLVPVLKKAISYKRAVGYFSISSLELLASGLENIVENSGKIEFIVSPELSDKDLEMIENGYLLREEMIVECLSDEIESEHKLKNPNTLDLIVHLIKENIFELKIAFMNNGIFHEKIGELSDKKGDRICFSGSMNETFSGFEINTESITVFNSWTPVISEYADGISNRISRVWDNEAKGVVVIDFPTVLKHKLIDKYRVSSSLEEALSNYKKSIRKKEIIKETIEPFDELKLYKYQEEAIEEFGIYNYQHFYEMATGTGKTFTAIRSIEALERAKGAIYVTVVVPSIDLQIQWYEEFEKAGYKNVQMLGGYKSNVNWKYDFERSLIKFEIQQVDNAESMVYIAVADSYFDKMVDEIGNIENYMIIIDEAHDLSSNRIKKLPQTAKYRLGLSATPERHNENEIEAILNYFLTSSQETYKYTIEDAIKFGALTKYNYYPIPVELTEDEYEKYKKYSRDLMIEFNKKVKDENKISKLLNVRSLIVKKAENKLKILIEELERNVNNFRNSVVYCGAGKGNNDEEISLLHEVSRNIYKYGELRVSSYTSKTENRNDVLEQFEKSFFDVLVAIKCFDQGVDVPKLEKIHLMASDSNRRQTIQRRGRVLRKCKETGKKLAHIYDYVVLAPSTIPYESTMSTLLKNELYRVEEYLRLADNYDEMKIVIDEWKVNFPIQDEEEVSNEKDDEHY